MKRVIILSITTLVLAAGFTSCKKDNDKEPNSFKVRMTDAPGDYLQLNVQITSVEAYHGTQGWVNLSAATQSMNILDYTNGSEIELANAVSVSAGNYSKLRFTFGSQADIVLIGGGSAINLNWASSSQQFEVPISADVDGDTKGNVLIDFNVAKSITQVGATYSFNPKMTVIQDESTGVSGHVVGQSSAMIQLTNGSTTYNAYVNGQGNFLMKGVSAGTYAISVWISGAIVTQEIGNVVVTQGQITSMGNIEL